MTSVKSVRVGVIGLGHLGKIHARIYSGFKDVRITFVCDIIKTRAKRIAEELNVPYSTDFRDCLGEVDALSIATPTSSHYQIAKECIKHKIDVLVEKPLAPDLMQAKRLITLAKKNNCILQVGHVERFNKALQAIRDIPGEIKFIECHRIGPFKKRSLDISVVLDLMIHDLDIILELVPSKVKQIQAVGTRVITPLPDIANSRIRFENGTICNITSSRVSEEALRKIRIFKENCYISLDYMRQTVKIYTKQKNKIRRKNIKIKKAQPLKLELRSFIDAVKNRREPPSSGEKVLSALDIALKIEQKILKNK